VLAATSDQPAVVRARAAYAATAVAEHFRSQGAHVFMMMDSVTRFAMARREIDLAAGQPPTSRGYTPSVFTEIPALCERCGTVANGGSITAVYTVLVEGDDHNEPIADALRATLDGHVVLTRDLAHQGHFPAVDVLHSVSRLESQLLSEPQRRLQSRLRSLLSAHAKHREMVDMGLYKNGSNAVLDEALAKAVDIQAFLRQGLTESSSLEQTHSALSRLVGRGPEMNGRRNTRWLDLAVKARQWAIDAQGQELKEAQTTARQAETRQQQASRTLVQAQAGRSAVLLRETFAAADLADHGAYEGRLRVECEAARQRMLEAQDQEQAVRGQVMENLSQRDALAGCLEKVHLADRLDEARRAAREHDELWLLRAGSTMEASRED